MWPRIKEHLVISGTKNHMSLNSIYGRLCDLSGYCWHTLSVQWEQGMLYYASSPSGWKWVSMKAFNVELKEPQECGAHDEFLHWVLIQFKFSVIGTFPTNSRTSSWKKEENALRDVTNGCEYSSSPPYICHVNISLSLFCFDTPGVPGSIDRIREHPCW